MNTIKDNDNHSYLKLDHDNGKTSFGSNSAVIFVKYTAIFRNVTRGTLWGHCGCTVGPPLHVSG